MFLEEEFVHMAEAMNLIPIELWTDGSGQYFQAPSGAGIVAVSRDVIKEFSVPLGIGTANSAELSAVREGLLRIKNRLNAWVRVYTDSKYVLGSLRPDSNWYLTRNVDLIVETRKLTEQCGRFEISHIPGHKGIEHNERADKLAHDARLVSVKEDADFAVCFGHDGLREAWKEVFRAALIEHGVLKPPQEPEPPARVIPEKGPLPEPDARYFNQASKDWDDWGRMAA